MILYKCFFVQHSNICVIKKSHVWPVEKDEITQAKLVLLSLLLLCNFMNGTKKNKNWKSCRKAKSADFYVSYFSFQVYRWFSTVSLNRECYSRHIVFCKSIKKDLRQCEIISGCIYWHFEQFLNLCWMLSVAANKVCIWPMLSLSQWRMTTFKKESSGNTHGTLHHSHHLFTTVQKQRNMERSLYGKLSVISLEAV